MTRVTGGLWDWGTGGLFLTAGLILLPVSATQERYQLAPFDSIEASDGAHVVLRYGPTQRVNLVKGSPDYSRVEVTNGTLVIQKCPSRCRHGYEMEVEVQVPRLERISLANSGRIRSVGSFPRQDELTVLVEHGGTVDARSMPASTVTATVNQGGGILTTPEVSLSARVTQGGVIMYWGDPQVKSSVNHGGVVRKGTARDVNWDDDAQL